MSHNRMHSGVMVSLVRMDDAYQVRSDNSSSAKNSYLVPPIRNESSSISDKAGYSLCARSTSQQSPRNRSSCRAAHITESTLNLLKRWRFANPLRIGEPTTWYRSQGSVRGVLAEFKEAQVGRLESNGVQTAAAKSFVFVQNVCNLLIFPKWHGRDREFESQGPPNSSKTY